MEIIEKSWVGKEKNSKSMFCFFLNSEAVLEGSFSAFFLRADIYKLFVLKIISQILFLFSQDIFLDLKESKHKENSFQGDD